MLRIPKAGKRIIVSICDRIRIINLLTATKKAAILLENALETPRIAMVFEGTGVPYVHAKLYPLHGELASQTNIWSEHAEYTEKYLGYITTAEGPRASDQFIDQLQQKILSAHKTS